MISPMGIKNFDYKPLVYFHLLILNEKMAYKLVDMFLESFSSKSYLPICSKNYSCLSILDKSSEQIDNSTNVKSLIQLNSRFYQAVQHLIINV